MKQENGIINKGTVRACGSGFTLVELLVVVLIIGILAAVALPQYNKSIIKSRYATLKPLVNSLAQAQEVYYMENDKYATDFEELDVSMPEGKLDSSTTGSYEYSWGWCNIASNLAPICYHTVADMAYQVNLTYTGHPNQRFCIAYGTSDENSMRSKICKAETGATTYTGKKNNKWISFSY